MNRTAHHNHDEGPPNKRQRTESLPIEHPLLTTDSNAKKIIHLNDSCVEKNFEHLGIESLFNIAIANKCLRPAVARVYVRRFGRFPVLINGYPFQTDQLPTLINEQIMCRLQIDHLKGALRFLRCFGAQITVLEFDATQYTKKKKYKHINKYINKYCSENMISLTFESVPKISTKHFRKPFVNVTNVTVKNGGMKRLPSFTEWFPNIRHLKLIHVHLFQHRLTAHHFPHLEHLIVYPEFGMKGHFGYKLKEKLKKQDTVKVEAAEMQRFVNNHPQLVELDLPWYELTPTIANNLVRQLSSLTKFRFQLNASQYEHFVSSLEHWKCSKQSLHSDNVCVTLEKYTQ